MCRRCVVCGNKTTGNDRDRAYYYPKNNKEARIWQQSMGAHDICVDKIQQCCCVCIEHIPQFVERAQSQAKLIKAEFEQKTRAESYKMCRPSLNVLLLAGATLPPYCGKSCEVTFKDDPEEEQDNSLDSEIVVRESVFKDLGTSFPDIDETEVTVLRTPLHNDEELKKLQQDDKKGEKNEECGDNASCLDVLLLGRSQPHETDKCPCRCEQCERTKFNPNDPTCRPKEQTATFDSNDPPCRCEPCNCELEQKTRLELSEIIIQQQQRICELEYLVCRQNDWHLSLQQKMADMYCEFGCLESAKDSNVLLNSICQSAYSCQQQTQEDSQQNPQTEHLEQRNSNVGNNL